MTALTSMICPSCSAIVGEDDHLCAQCGFVVQEFRPASRTPLILPGNPALSADDTATGPKGGRRIAVGVVAGAMVIGTAAFIMLREPDAVEPPSESAMAALAADARADSIASEAFAMADSAAAFSASTLAPEVRVDSAAAVPPTPEPPAPVPASVAPVSVAPVSAAPVPAAPVSVAPTPVPANRPVVAAPAAAAPKVVAPKVVAPAGVAPAPAAAPVVASAPVLRLTPLVSTQMKPGEIVRLRGTVQDRATGRVLPQRIEFTSVDPTVALVNSRTGEVTAMAPGRVRIIADAGPGGQQTVTLVVRQPTPPVVAIVPSTRPVASRVTAAAALPTQPTPAPAPVRVASVAPTPANAPAVTPQAMRDLLPDAGDVRTAADRVIADVRAGGNRTGELTQFFTDGADHRIALLAAPTTISETDAGVRVRFEMRLTKYDGAGRPVTRVAPVMMEVARRGNAVSSSAIAIGALRKP